MFAAMDGAGYHDHDDDDHNDPRDDCHNVANQRCLTIAPGQCGVRGVLSLRGGGGGGELYSTNVVYGLYICSLTYMKSYV